MWCRMITCYSKHSPTLRWCSDWHPYLQWHSTAPPCGPALHSRWPWGTDHSHGTLTMTLKSGSQNKCLHDYIIAFTLCSCITVPDSFRWWHMSWPFWSLPMAEMKKGGVPSLVIHSATFLATPPNVCTKLPGLVPSLCGVNSQYRRAQTSSPTKISGLRILAVRSRMDPPITTGCWSDEEVSSLDSLACLTPRLLLPTSQSPPRLCLVRVWASSTAISLPTLALFRISSMSQVIRE